MDTSEKYVEMCEKAEEIQKNHVEERHDFYAILPEKQPEIKPFKIITGRYVWLPRQDQLQEIMGEFLNLAMLQFSKWYIQEIEPFGTKFSSPEQHWLAFVMERKFGKTWNGKDWIEEEKKQ